MELGLRGREGSRRVEHTQRERTEKETARQSSQTPQSRSPSKLWLLENLAVQFSSVAQSCPTICDPMDCSTPALAVHPNSRSLLKLMSIGTVMPSSHLILCRPLLLPPSSFPTLGSFPVSQFFASCGQSTGVSASASVLPMNT